MNTESSQKLGTMPIPKLLFSMSLPAILSMLVQSLYNIVDSIFVSNFSDTALTAVSLSFPVQTFSLAIALGISIGSASIISRRLGEGNPEAAYKIAKNGCFLTLCTTLFFMLFGYLFATGYARLYTKPDTILYSDTKSYLVICLVFSFGMFFDMYCCKVLQAIGKMIIPMVTQIVGAITNIVLDYILIFGKLGLPAMGVKGAAIATVIGQIVSMIISLSCLFTKNSPINIGLSRFRVDKNSVNQIVKLGFPITVMNSITSVAVTFLNGILIKITKVAVDVLGIYFKTQSFVFMPIFGLNQGSLPILSYNYGANLKKRFNKTMACCALTSYSIMIIGIILFQVIPDKILSLFDATPDMIRIGVPALRIISVSFLFAGAGIIISNMFQSIGHGFKSMLMSLLRQLVLLLPFAFIFSKVSSINSVWFAFPIAEILTISIFIPIAVKTVKKVFLKQEEFLNAQNAASD